MLADSPMATNNKVIFAPDTRVTVPMPEWEAVEAKKLRPRPPYEEATSRWQGHGAEKVPLWLDCDTGHDDAYAILLSARCPAIDLLGVSTVYGNASLTNTTYNTSAILTAIGRDDVSVYVGAPKPLSREPASAPDIHGETGLDGTTCLPAPRVAPNTTKSAVQAISEALSSQPRGKAWLVATGSLTNIALLFTEYPDLAAHIAGLSIMGGAIGGKFSDAPMGHVQSRGERFGNWTPWAEFNIYCDPEAANVIFKNPVLSQKTTLIPLDLTHQFIAADEPRQMLLHGQVVNRVGGEPSPVRKLFGEIIMFFATTYAEVFGLVDGPPLHDPLAVAACFAPDLFADNRGERFAVSVVTQGDHGSGELIRDGSSQCGRTIAEKLRSGQSGVRIPRALDESTLWAILDKCLASVDNDARDKMSATAGTTILA